MFFRQVFEPKLAQYAYIIGCQRSGEAIVIDPMRDIDVYERICAAEKLRIVAATETHIHADFVSGLREFAEKGIKVYASDEGTADWKYEYLKGSTYDFEFLYHGSEIRIGNIKIRALHTPGHTPEHLIFEITDGAAADEPMGLATGDFVFVGDVGRPDLLESAAGFKGMMDPSARTLFKSLQQFHQMPDYLQVWPGHGAGSACGKSLGAVPESTVGYERRFNQAIRSSARSEQSFVDFILDGQPEPPLYFARMKRWNKMGAPVVGTVQKPVEFDLEAFDKKWTEQHALIIDTRPVASFMAQHVPGSISIVCDNSFNTVAGSYVQDGQEVILVIDPSKTEDAMRDLLRVGVDNVSGFISPDTLLSWFETGGASKSTRVMDFSNLKSVPENGLILDVRKKNEFEEKHIDGALHAVHVRLPEMLARVPADKTLYVHCQSGKRASYASSYLESKGFDVVYVNDHFKNAPV